MLRQVWADAAITISDSSSGTECSNCNSNTDDNLVWNIWGFPKIKSTIIGGHHNKDYSILGSILGSPNFGRLPFTLTVSVWSAYS